MCELSTAQATIEEKIEELRRLVREAEVMRSSLSVSHHRAYERVRELQNDLYGLEGALKAIKKHCAGSAQNP